MSVRVSSGAPKTGRGPGAGAVGGGFKLFPNASNGLRNPSKRTERSLNFPNLRLRPIFGSPLSLFWSPIGTFWQKVPINHNDSSFKFLMVSELRFSRAEQWTLRLLELNYFVYRWFFFLALVVRCSKHMHFDLANRLVWNWLRFRTWWSKVVNVEAPHFCLLYTSPSPRD